MKYYVTYKIEARYIAEVEADNLEEAMEKAESEYMDADFGVAEDIDGEAIIVEDEAGNFVWER
jgi:phosphomannomutase